jgi:cytochrome bd-type quinol oxidase subunit 2
MKSIARTYGLILLAVGGGVVGLGLRILMYATGIDEKGLLTQNHPLDILCWIVALVLGVLFFVAVRRQEVSCRYEDNFPVSAVAALGCFAAAGGSLVLGFQLRKVGDDTLSNLWCMFAFLSSAAFGATGWCRMKGKRPVFLFHMVICLFFCIHTICNYRI